MKSVRVAAPITYAVAVDVVNALVVVIRPPGGVTLEFEADDLEVRIDPDQVRVAFLDLVRLSKPVPRPVLINEPAHRFLEQVPIGGVSLPDCHAEVYCVREWRIPVGPIIRSHGVVRSDVRVQFSYEHRVRVHVHAAVFEHEVDSPDVGHVRDDVHVVSIDHARRLAEDQLYLRRK